MLISTMLEKNSVSLESWAEMTLIKIDIWLLQYIVMKKQIALVITFSILEQKIMFANSPLLYHREERRTLD